jgi:hypothetical protein
MTPFCPTRANNGATAARLHAHEKSVRALSANDGRLVGPFHDDLPEKLVKSWN